MKEFFEKLAVHLRDNHINAECDWGSIMFLVDIKWGDWKHNHLRCDYLVEEFAKENGREITLKREVVTEDDGSDCYSAKHYYIF